MDVFLHHLACLTALPWLQVVIDVTLRPQTVEEIAIVSTGDDVPEPMFPGNQAGEANSCMINHSLKCSTLRYPFFATLDHYGSLFSLLAAIEHAPF
jgi:hypothetical protein